MSSLSMQSTAVEVGGTLRLGECFQDYSGFTLEEHLGSGSFASVFRGRSTSNDQKVAIKIEPNEGSRSKLEYEVKVYKCLAKHGDKKVPKVHWQGMVGNVPVMVMDLLGPSLQDVFSLCQHQLSQKQIWAIGTGILSSVEYLHSKGFIHRNIKPQNIVFSSQSISKVYIVGLSLAKKYVEKSQVHIALQKTKLTLADTVFSSLRSHLRVQQSRRDDIEAVGHILLYLTKGALPWSGVEKDDMKVLKAACCAPPFCPRHISKFIQHGRGLSFEEAPNYSYLRSLLRKSIRAASRVKLGNPVPQYSYDQGLNEYNFISDWTIRVPLGQHIIGDWHSSGGRALRLT